MWYLLNIGKNIGDRRNALSDQRIYTTLRSNDLLVAAYRVAPGDEGTAVVKVLDLWNGDGRAQFVEVARSLQQDCIAVVPLDADGNCVYERGALIGPNAEAWAEFDPTLFIGESHEYA